MWDGSGRARWRKAGAECAQEEDYDAGNIWTTNDGAVRGGGLTVLVLVLASALMRKNGAGREDALGAATPTASGVVATVSAGPQDAQCVATVPKTWGQYRGGSAQSGLSFEDANGTLRFVTNLPCGSVPTVALEIRRSGNY